MEELSPLQPFGDCYEIFKSANQTGKTAEKVAQCKHLARDIKKKRATRGSLPTNFLRQSLPELQVMDGLVELYFNTFESCFRILYLPSFLAFYENFSDDPDSTRDPFLLQLLLVTILAGTIHDDCTVGVSPRRWVDRINRPGTCRNHPGES